jgi:hypothetical protein
MTKKSKTKQWINLSPGKINRLVFHNTNPVYNPRVDAISDNARAELHFTVLTTTYHTDLSASVRFTVAIAAPAPAAPPAGGAAPAPGVLPTDGTLSVTLVDDPASGADIPVDVEPVNVDYIDDPDDP